MLTDTNEIILHIADLIERGSQGREQCSGMYIRHNGAVCSMGACLIAAEIDPETAYRVKFSMCEALGIFSWPRIAYPSADSAPFTAINGKAPLEDVVIWLNDKQGWSFSRIVAYLRSLATITPETTPAPQKSKRRKTG